MRPGYALRKPRRAPSRKAAGILSNARFISFTRACSLKVSVPEFDVTLSFAAMWALYLCATFGAPRGRCRRGTACLGEGQGRAHLGGGTPRHASHARRANSASAVRSASTVACRGASPPACAAPSTPRRPRRTCQPVIRLDAPSANSRRRARLGTLLRRQALSRQAGRIWADWRPRQARRRRPALLGAANRLCEGVLRRQLHVVGHCVRLLRRCRRR